MENYKKIVRLVNLRAFRAVNEISQKEVADFLDVSISFVSAVERGLAKLPAEKLARLLENDREWETGPLLDQAGAITSIHNDHRNIGQNVEGEFNAPVSNNHYDGFSTEEFDERLKERTSMLQMEINGLKGMVEDLRRRLAHADDLTERLLRILEKADLKAPATSGDA